MLEDDWPYNSPPPNFILAVLIVFLTGGFGFAVYEYGFWSALVYAMVPVGVFLAALVVFSAFAGLVWGIKLCLDQITPWGTK